MVTTENTSAGRGALRVAGVALAVALGYYLGVRIGLVLRFPTSTTSILWPPNAFLAAVLLLSPPRRWAIYLLAAFPVHLLGELAIGWPWPLVVLLYLTNCGEALLTALLIRRFSDAPVRFDTVRRVSVFLAASVAAAFATSFPDAGAVSQFRGEAFWEVWRTRSMSNVVAALVLIPALVIVVRDGRRWLRRFTLRRAAEAALLVLALVAIGLWVFAVPVGAAARVAGSRIVLVVPVLILATVRFGSAGTSLGLFGTGLISLWAGTQGRGPFSALPPDADVVAIQLVLIALGMPLLFLAGALGERKAVRERLEERLGFEELLSQLAGAFIHLPRADLRKTVDEWLRRLGEWLGVDRIVVLRFSGDGMELRMAHCWTGPSDEPAADVVACGELPATFACLLREEAVLFPPRPGSSESSAAGAELARHCGTGSVLALPLVVGDRVLGALGFCNVASARRLSVNLEYRLQPVAAVLAGALARYEAEDALRASESMSAAILASLPSRVAVVDRARRVVAVNASWQQAAAEAAGGAWDGTAPIGADYVEVCSRAPVQDPAAMAAGVAAVIAGERSFFATETSFGGRGEQRWFALAVVPLDRSEAGAVVSSTDVTAHKRAELEAQRSREELAHVTRVSTLGVLGGSLAHEINQPLAAIMANAQAGRVLLSAQPPDTAELGEILDEIAGDVRRADEVIQRLRVLMRKGASEPKLLDLNGVVAAVAALLHSDAVIRKVAVTVDRAPGPLEVMGDRVQLQQVVLNLLTNALEAASEVADRKRSVAVRMSAEDGSARVTVEDSGPGLSAAALDRAFEPFFSTKPEGMGMGLSIARSIVTAHGGTIGVAGDPERGAIFHFTVPLSSGTAT